MAATLSLTAPTANAAGGGGVGDQVGGTSGNGQIAVKVTLTGTAVGNGGTTASGGGSGGGVTTVYTPPACYWDSLNGAYTGKTMYERLKANGNEWYVGSETSYLPSPDAVTAHKDDDGIWYTIAPGPNSNVVGGSNGGGYGWDKITGDCMTRMRAGAGAGNNGGPAGYIFVPTGTAPPAPQPAPPTPEQLRDAALAGLTLPTPQLGHNPTTQTLVNLPTWFWVPRTDFRVWTITATAAIPGIPAASATVTATPSALSVSSAGGSSGPCSATQAVTAWGPAVAESGACTVSFAQSSVGQPAQAYTVTGTTAYTTGWTSTVAGGAGPGGPLGDVSRTGQVPVAVAEVQALVR